MQQVFLDVEDKIRVLCHREFWTPEKIQIAYNYFSENQAKDETSRHMFIRLHTAINEEDRAIALMFMASETLMHFRKLVEWCNS